MALQDIPIAHLPESPYPFGSPEYQAAILPFLEKQLQAQAREASNARGGFYSGAGMADEQQAASNLAYQMAQQGAQQAEAEKQMMEQQKFQSSENQINRQAQADAEREARKSAMMGQAIGGLTSPLGMIGGLYGYDKLKGFMGGKPPSIPGAVADPGMGAGPELLPGGGSGFPEIPDGNYLAQQYGADGGGGNISDVVGGTNAGQGAAAGMPSLGGFEMPGFGSTAAGLAGSMYGSQAGLRTFGNGTSQKVGSGIGGAAGTVLGAPFGPMGSALGSYAGSYLGASYGKHPGLLALGPFGAPIAAIPGAPHYLQQNLVNPVSNAFSSAGRSIGHFLGGLF